MIIISYFIQLNNIYFNLHKFLLYLVIIIMNALLLLNYETFIILFNLLIIFFQLFKY